MRAVCGLVRPQGWGAGGGGNIGWKVCSAMNFRTHRTNRCQRRWHGAVAVVCIVGQLLGCRTPRDVHYLGDTELQHYRQAATQVDYPHVHTDIEPAVYYAEKPPTIRDPFQGEVWE